eukprot:299243_1
MATLTVAYCPANHTLTQFKTPDANYYCDVCNRNLNEQTILFGCRECDYDICQSCQTIIKKQPIHNPTSLKQSLQQLSNLSRLHNQCKISKQLFSNHVNNKLSNFNPFYSQLDTMINDMAWTTMVRIPHQTQINESNISVFSDAIKCNYMPVAIKCLHIINNFVMDNAKNSNFITQHKFIPALLNILNKKTENDDLNDWAIYILRNISDYNIDAFANTDVIETCLTFIKHQSVKLEIKTACIVIFTNLCKKSTKYRNLCLQQSILNHVLPLCSATNYSIELLKHISQLYLGIIGSPHDILPDKKQIILILQGMS